MKFTLECAIALTRKLPEAEIKSVLKEAAPLLGKGAPGGVGASVEDVRVKGDVVSVTLSSGTYVRPHDAVFRLKNFFSRELGRKHKVGVRDIRGVRYVIEFELTHGIEGDLNIPYADDVKVSGKKCTLKLSSLSEEFLKKNYVDRMIKLIQEKAKQKHFGAREEHHEIVYTGKKKIKPYKDDPTQELLRRKWIKRTPTRNQFIFGPQITELCEALRRAYVDVVYKPLGFSEMVFPKIVDWDIWKKSGHVLGLYSGGFNPYLFTTPKSLDPADWEEVVDKIKITGDIPIEDLMERLDPPTGGLAFAQCPPFWTYLEGETISTESLPIKVFDWSGPTYRYEAGGAHGFERVDELHRIETLWVGTEKQTREITEKVRTALRSLLEDVLELEIREAWVTPWFMAQKGLVDVEEGEQMVVGTVDFEGILPYNKKWLEVQNVSNNGDSYPKAFNAKGQKEALWSGCAGGSFERYLSCLLAQKGFDPENWPKKFRKYVSVIPEEIRFL